MYAPQVLTLLTCGMLASITAALSIPQPISRRADQELVNVTGPPVFLLAGDSTTAVQSTGGGGWGDGFLTTLSSGAIGKNLGHDGATTVSFVSGGDWANVLDLIAEYKDDYTPIVTIQFGHNDQKAENNISVVEFTSNLEQLAQDVWDAGGNPILVTSLTRRTFNSSGVVVQDLSVQAAATIAAAENVGSFYIDLNGASTDYVNAIGANDSATYNRITTDYTHLNAAGSVLFGNMVSGLIDAAVGDDGSLNITDYTAPNSTIEADIEGGVYIYPSGFGTLPNNTLTSV